MKRFNGIVESTSAPSPKDIWLYKGSLKYFGPLGWTNIEADVQNNTPPVAPEINWDGIINKPELAAVATSGVYNDLIGKPDLKPIATSGDYNDLINKPDISGGSGDIDLTNGLIINNTYTDGTKIGIGGTVRDGYTSWGLYSYVNSANQGSLELSMGGDGPKPVYIRHYDGNSKDSIVSSATREVALLDQNWNTRFPGYVFAHNNKVLVDTEDARLSDTRNPSVTSLVADLDLNTITTPGLYVCGEDRIAATLKNCPTNMAFSMTVSTSAATEGSCSLLIIEYLPARPNMMYRTIYRLDLTELIGGWNTVYSTINPPTTVTASTNGLMKSNDYKTFLKMSTAGATNSLRLLRATQRVLNVDIDLITTDGDNLIFGIYSGSMHGGQLFTIVITNVMSSAINLDFSWCSSDSKNIIINSKNLNLSQTPLPPSKWIILDVTRMNNAYLFVFQTNSI